jgi:hypothetical protein
MVLPLTGEYCFRCVFGMSGLSCQTEGILNTTAYATASLQVSEGLKVLLHEKKENRLLIIDTWNNTLEKIKPKRDPHCVFCQGRTTKEKETGEFSVRLCRHRNRIIITPHQRTVLDLEQIRERYDISLITPIVLVMHLEGTEIIVYQHGEIAVTQCTDEEKGRKIARQLYMFRK